MKKLLRNKRMFLTLVAGLLVFVAVLGAGTFAWFTGTADVKIEQDIYTAIVKVDATDFEVATYDFYPGVRMSVSWQEQLEATFGDQDAYEDLIHQLYTSADPQWLYDVGDPEVVFGWNLTAAKGRMLLGFPAENYLTYVYDKLIDVPKLPIDPANPFPLRLIKNALDFNYYKDGLAAADIVNVTPSSLIVGDYSFDVKGSTVPVYFRVEGISLNAVDAAGDPIVPAYNELVRVVLRGTWEGGDKGFAAASMPTLKDVVADLQYVDGYWYCSLPLSPLYAWAVDVKYDIYLFGEENGDELQNVKLWFSNTETGEDVIKVDIIQATNNAVYLADEWKDVAGDIKDYGPPPFEPFFVPYITDAWDMYDTYKMYFSL